jgi:hypothetical protein
MKTTNIYIKIGGWRTLRKEEFRIFDSQPDLTRAIKSSRIRWTGYVAQRREMRTAYAILTRTPEGTP